MHAFSFALLYGILWISSVHGSEDNNVRRLSKDIPEQEFVEPHGESALFSSRDHGSLDYESKGFYRRYWIDIIVAFSAIFGVFVAVVYAASKGQWVPLVVLVLAGSALGGIFCLVVALYAIRYKDELVKEGSTPSWRDVLKYYFKHINE